jgi:hypothetical protein
MSILILKSKSALLIKLASNNDEEIRAIFFAKCTIEIIFDSFYYYLKTFLKAVFSLSYSIYFDKAIKWVWDLGGEGAGV